MADQLKKQVGGLVRRVIHEELTDLVDTEMPLHDEGCPWESFETSVLNGAGTEHQIRVVPKGGPARYFLVKFSEML